MMKLLTLLTVLMVSLSSWALTWDTYQQEKAELVSHERHLPYRLYHGHKTKKSVLLIHGIYSSPLYFKGMAEFFFEAGYNVVTVLLPGHFEKNLKSLKRTQIADWTHEADQGFALAKELGDQVILVGHSLGGVLSLGQAMKREGSDDIHSIVILSPALKVWNHVLASCFAGLAWDLNGNMFNFAEPDGYQVPYYAPVAGPMIQSLANTVKSYVPSKPTYLVYAWEDNVVNIPFVKKWALKLNKNNSKVRVYPFGTGITHGSISQAPEDYHTHGNGKNYDFYNMMQEALEFVESVK